METTPPQTFIDRLDSELPPFLAYYLARKYPHGPWAGPTVIAQRSGLTRRTVTRLGAKISWKGVAVNVMSAFLSACGFQCRQGSVFVMYKLRSYMRWCCNKAVVPLNHLDSRAWKQFNKLSRLHLIRNGAPQDQKQQMEGTIHSPPEHRHRSITGLKLLRQNEALSQENKSLRLRIRILLLATGGSSIQEIAKQLAVPLNDVARERKLALDVRPRH